MTDGPTVDLIPEKANWSSTYADGLGNSDGWAQLPGILTWKQRRMGPKSRGRLWMGPEHTYLLAKMVADGLNMLGRDSGIDPSTHVCGIGKGDGWAQHSSYIAENGGGRAQRKYVLGKPVYLVSAKGTGGPKFMYVACRKGATDGPSVIPGESDDSRAHRTKTTNQSGGYPSGGRQPLRLHAVFHRVPFVLRQSGRWAKTLTDPGF
ncbi:hypothetical protein C8R48DRAFT_680439 [Suillus tomentosus]|nr:hypothetical protein C8R48DRAFT_680439 [Suillus tomentosus]